MPLPLLIILLVIVLTIGIGGFSGAPWLPTKPKQIQFLLENIDIKKGQIIYDLGCGDGIILFSCAKKFPEAQFIGYEISPLVFLFAKIKSLFYKNVTIKFGNFLQKDLSNADIIFIFLLDRFYEKLRQKLISNIRKEALIYIEAWPFKNTEPHKIFKKEKLLPIYLYRVSDL